MVVLRFAGFELDELRAELRGPGGEVIKLRPKPFTMLQVFAANAGRTLSKQELMQAVWPNVHVGEDSLFQCIREIRSVLGDDDRKLIKLVSGRGYLFEAEVTRVSADAARPAATPEASEPAQPNPPPSGEAEPAAAATMPEIAGDTPEVREKDRAPLRGVARRLAAVLVGLCAIVGLAVGAAALRPDILSPMRRPTIAVTITDPGNDPQARQMAANVTADIAEGLAKISNIRVLSPPAPAVDAKPVAYTPSDADIVVEGRLQKDGNSWILRARATNTNSGEVRWSTAVSVATENVDEMLQRSRLAGGLGHNLAVYLNTLYYPGERPGASDAQAHAKIVVDQATAYIDQTSRERFAASQAMLENALAKDPDNVDLEAALAADLLRGIQTAWYIGADADTAEHKAQALLERAMRQEPQYLPVLESYCRFMTATNHFVESLVACANALTFDPWDGLVRFNLGMAQDELGRFAEALATFKEADRYDTPQVSRWTWLLGAGLTLMLMDRDEEALPWLQRSLAITPGTGRTQILLAAAYQRLGRTDEAKAALAKALGLRPGSTAANVEMPPKNTSPLWREACEKITRAEIAAGLPEH
jgi:DNA-binding winged helix-turn-helix (wHTH) protein/tetratricopeptide (TPR) repeat protein/TolB-like protein